MQTVFETRKIRLGMLKKQYGKWATLNEAIGWDKTSARLSQIHSGTMRKDRGTPFVMGDVMAREIEEALKLATGWMDTPPTYAELHRGNDPRITAMLAMESMPDDEISQVLRFINAVTEPAKDGTNS
jgi:hypothetical protein